MEWFQLDLQAQSDGRSKESVVEDEGKNKKVSGSVKSQTHGPTDPTAWEHKHSLATQALRHNLPIFIFFIFFPSAHNHLLQPLLDLFFHCYTADLMGGNDTTLRLCCLLFIFRTHAWAAMSAGTLSSLGHVDLT